LTLRVDVLHQKLAEWYASGQNFCWRDNEIFFRAFGNGPAMLMVHGFPTAGFDWVEIASTLSKHFRLIVPDLADYGRSKNLTGKTFHIHDQASMLEGLLRQVNVSQVHVVAHDVGDTVCQELLARQNNGQLSFQIESLILMNGGILPAEHRPRNVQKLLLSPIGPLVASLTSKEKFMSALPEVFGAETRPD
jgi:pimeloyl-ACP methyl ester carboxylesterase